MAAQFQLTHLRTALQVQRESFPLEFTPIRNQLYYEFVTTIQQARGRGNQVIVPTCVKRLVRRTYPDRFFEHPDGDIEAADEGGVTRRYKINDAYDNAE